MGKYNKIILIIAAIITVTGILFITGCGSDEGNKADGEEANTLKVGMLGKDIKTACIIIANEEGLYKEEGVNVTFETISNLSDAITAVEQGKLDVLPFGVIPSATFISQGSDVVIFGGTISEGSEIITIPENSESFKNPEDFVGKKIGCYRMETGHMIMKGVLREAGIDIEKDLEFVLLDSQQTIIEAVKKGEVDCGFVNSGQGYVAEQSGLAVAETVSSFDAKFPCCRQTTSGNSMKNKRDALVKFEIANLRAYEIYMNDKNRTIEILTEYSGQPEDYVNAVMYGTDDYKNAMIISMNPEKKKVEEFYEDMKANGDIDADTEYDISSKIDTYVYKDALNELISRGNNKELYESLMKSFVENN